MPEPEKKTRVERFNDYLSDHPIVSVLIIVGVVISALAGFTDAVSKLWPHARRVVRPPHVVMTAAEPAQGPTVLTFKFLEVPDDFSVDRVRLHFSRPVSGPLLGNPSGQVKEVVYDLLVPEDVLSREDGQLDAELRLYHDPKEPYTLAELRLWWSRPDSRVTLSVRPEYFDAAGNALDIHTDPAELQIRLQNSRLTRAVAGPPTVPRKGGPRPR